MKSRTLLFIFTLPFFCYSQVNEINFTDQIINFSSSPRTAINPMSIKLWNSYQNGGPSAYGTVLEIYGLYGHQTSQLNFGGGDNSKIGTTTPDKELTVNGTIHSKEVIVDTNFTPDYVFQKYYTGKSELKSDYVMPTLTEIENFTKNNNHLPNVPSAKEI